MKNLMIQRQIPWMTMALVFQNQKMTCPSVHKKSTSMIGEEKFGLSLTPSPATRLSDKMPR